MSAPIELYTWPTPNGHKIHIALEEMGLPYNAHAVDIGAGDQFQPAFLKISPNNKIPAMVDPDGPDGKPIALMESGAMLIYLAEKTGQLMPADLRGRMATLQWLMFQMAGVGPMLGQTHHFRAYAPEPYPYAIDRYTNETTRLYRVLDARLGEATYLAGDSYTIADIATWPWLRYWDRQGQDLNAHPNLKRWFDAIGERPAVQRGLEVLHDRSRSKPFTAQEREILFGSKQLDRRT
ncbi:glutathione binding-like protein [Dongia sp.]|uniref:glutathione binding-like protein n=1 Tax=Dongia sp. TaxID=1977262 RepID=UPI0035B3A641